MIDISGIPKHVLLAALYNKMRPQGTGPYRGIKMIMSEGCAQELISEFQAIGARLSFNQVGGRFMGADLETDEFNPGPYNFYHGDGAAELVIGELRRLLP